MSQSPWNIPRTEPIILCPTPKLSVAWEFRSSGAPRLGTHHSSHKESLEGITLSIGIIVRVPCEGRREFLSGRYKQSPVARRMGRSPSDRRKPLVAWRPWHTFQVPVSPKHSNFYPVQADAGKGYGCHEDDRMMAGLSFQTYIS